MASEPRILVDRALAADAAAAAAARQLVERLHPVIKARVARVLRRSRSDGAAWQHQVEDRAQDVLLALFDNGGHVLRSWKPELGLSLENFVGLFAERRTISALRGVQPPIVDRDPTLEDIAEDTAGPPAAVESALVTRELLEILLDRLRELLSPLAMRLFELVYMDGCSVEEVAKSTGLSTDAVYAWRSRLRRLVVRLAGEVQNASLPAVSPPPGDVGHAR